MAFPDLTINNGTDANSQLLNQATAAGFVMPSGGLSQVDTHAAVVANLLLAAPTNFKLPATYVEGGVAAGGANGGVTLIKRVTGIADAAATAVLTITVPNVAAAAVVQCTFVGIAGAAGAIGTCEDVTVVSYNFSVCRTPGVAMGAKASTAFGSAAAVVAGAGTMTCVSADPTLTGEGVTVTNTGIIKVTIDQSSTSTNHICLVYAKVINYLGTGVTIA